MNQQPHHVPKLNLPLIQSSHLNSHDRRFLHGLMANKEVRTIAPTVYMRHDKWAGLEANARAQAVSAAVAGQSRTKGRIIAGKSAAGLMDIPTVGRVPYGRVEAAHTRYTKDSLVIPRSLHPRATTTIAPTTFGDIPVTDHVSTCIDLGRWHSLEDFVVATEHCLHQKIFYKSDLHNRVDRMSGAPGITLVKTALKLVNDLSESPRESEWKVKMWRRNMEPPFQQARILDHRGNFVARVDFFWPIGLVGEYDGGVKYDDHPKILSATLDSERERERSLLNLGLYVVRANSLSFRTGEDIDLLMSQHRRLSAERRPFPAAQFRATVRAWV